MAEYIERDKAVESIKKLISNMPAKDNYAKGYDAAIGRALVAVRGVSVTDVQPVKCGRWFHINDEGIVYCSECNNEAYWDTDYGQQLFDFCPYCGARMIKDGEQTD